MNKPAPCLTRALVHTCHRRACAARNQAEATRAAIDEVVVSSTDLTDLSAWHRPIVAMVDALNTLTVATPVSVVSRWLLGCGTPTRASAFN